VDGCNETRGNEVDAAAIIWMELIVRDYADPTVAASSNRQPGSLASDASYQDYCHQCFGEFYSVIFMLKIEAVASSEKFITICQSVRHHIQDNL
jgi:hypothetical protein